MPRRGANAARATGYETMISPDGSILQAGIPSRSSTMHHDIHSTNGWITRAVVIKTYYTDEDTRSGWTKGIQRNVLCDVRTLGRYSRPLAKVPVLQRTQGRWDEDIYIPRDSRQDLEGGQLAIGGTRSSARPTPAENLDGDHVLIGFLDNDPQQPVILPFQFSHPKSDAQPVLADGRRKRIRHNGTLVEWDAEGSFLIDASTAAAEVLGTKGAEEKTNAATVTIKTNTSTFIQMNAADFSQAGSMLLRSGGSITMRALDEVLIESLNKAITLTAEQDLQVNAKANAFIFAEEGNAELTAKLDAKLIGEDGVEIRSGGQILIGGLSPALIFEQAIKGSIFSGYWTVMTKTIRTAAEVTPGFDPQTFAKAVATAMELFETQATLPEPTGWLSNKVFLE